MEIKELYNQGKQIVLNNAKLSAIPKFKELFGFGINDFDIDIQLNKIHSLTFITEFMKFSIKEDSIVIMRIMENKEIRHVGLVYNLEQVQHFNKVSRDEKDDNI